MNKVLKRFLLITICFFACCRVVHSEDPGFRSKIIYREVMLNDNAIKTLGIQTEKVIEQEIDETIKTTGQIEEIPKNHFDVNSPVQGVVVSVNVDLGDAINIGESLVTIRSTEIAKLQAEVEQFKAELELAKKNYERDKLLFERRVSPRKDLDISESLLVSAEAKLNAAKNNLKILTGLSADSKQGEFSIRSPKIGTIVERNISIGQVVNQNQVLFRGIDLSAVWASADIFEKDLGNVALGQRVSVILDGTQGKTFEGNLTYIGSIINKDTRTLPVKVTLKNVEGLLKPGAFAKLIIHTGLKKKSIIIPQLALAETDKEGTEGKHEHIVYVKENNSFSPRKVQVEAHDSDNVLVLSGLMNGDVIVTQGSYQLQYEQEDNEKEQQGINFPFLGVAIGVLSIIFITFLLKKKKS